MVSGARVLTTQELAVYMKLNDKTILKMAQKGELSGVKVGNQWRFHLEAIERYLTKNIIHAPENRGDSISSGEEHPVPLSRFFDRSLIEPDLKALNKEEVLDELVDIADISGIVNDRDKLSEELRIRERMLSTAVGKGVAVPHPRDPDPSLFKRAGIVIARSKEGVDFSSPDGKKVHMFFMICAADMTVHLRLLSKLSVALNSEGVIDEFLRVSDRDEMIQIFLEMERKRFFKNDLYMKSCAKS